jgi:hypothetical protein
MSNLISVTNKKDSFVMTGTWNGLSSATKITVLLDGTDAQNTDVFERGLRLLLGQDIRKTDKDAIDDANKRGTLSKSISGLMSGEKITVEAATEKITDNVAEMDEDAYNALIAKIESARKAKSDANS